MKGLAPGENSIAPNQYDMNAKAMYGIYCLQSQDLPSSSCIQSRGYGIIINHLPSSLLDQLSMDKRDSDGFF